MEIRSATEADFAAIRAVARDAWHDAYDELDAETIDHTVENWYTDDSMPLEAPGTIVLVAESDAHELADVPSGAGERTIVGFTHAVAQGECADVLRMYVHPDAQGEGIGTELHDRLLEAIERYDVDRVRAFDFAFNEDSRRFYEGVGFERGGQGEVEIDGERYPEATYVLERS